jgi:toxin ParE1/3/4
VQVKWLRAALRDLNGQLDYIANDNPEAAARLAARIDEATALLVEFPDLSRSGRVRGTRELVVSGTPWIIIYRLTDSVEVLRLLHAAQRWPPQRRSSY